MKALVPAVVSALLVFGCTPRPAVISDINDSSLKVETGLGTTDAMIQATAAEGCALYGKTPVWISHRCIDEYCFRKTVLFACKY